MKVEIIRALTGGLLTFVIVFCTVAVKMFFSADGHASSSAAASGEISGGIVAAAEADRNQKITNATDSPLPRQKNVSRPNENWLQGTKAERSRFEPLLQSRLAPALHVNSWTNSKPLSEADREGHVVVLVFWSTWCQPCIDAIELNNRLYQHYGDRGVMVIGVCNNTGSENMGNIVRTKSIRYPVAIDDSSQRTVDAFKVQSLPTYFVIDKEGRLRFADIKRGRIDDAIEYLLSSD